MKHHLVHNFDKILEVINKEMQIDSLKQNIVNICGLCNTEGAKETISTSIDSGIFLMACLAIRGAFSKIELNSSVEYKNLYNSTVVDILESSFPDSYKNEFIIQKNGYKNLDTSITNALLRNMTLARDNGDYQFKGIVGNDFSFSGVLSLLILTVRGVADFVYTNEGVTTSKKKRVKKNTIKVDNKKDVPQKELKEITEINLQNKQIEQKDSKTGKKKNKRNVSSYLMFRAVHSKEEDEKQYCSFNGFIISNKTLYNQYLDKKDKNGKDYFNRTLSLIGEKFFYNVLSQEEQSQTIVFPPRKIIFYPEEFKEKVKTMFIVPELCKIVEQHSGFGKEQMKQLYNTIQEKALKKDINMSQTERIVKLKEENQKNITNNEFLVIGKERTPIYERKEIKKWFRKTKIVDVVIGENYYIILSNKLKLSVNKEKYEAINIGATYIA